MIKRLASALFVLLLAPALRPAAETTRVPTIEDLLKVKTVGGVQISPDGRWVSYAVTETDFKQDAYVTHLWLANTATGKAFQVTRGEKGVGAAQWSPDGEWLSFTSNRVGDKNQIFAISPEGGEAIQLTRSESSVGGFSWSRDGKRIAFTAADAPPPTAKDRKEHLGDFEVVRREYSHSHIWTLDVAEAMQEPVAGRQHAQQGVQRRRVLVVTRRDEDRVQRDAEPRPDSRGDGRHLPADGRRQYDHQARLAARTR
jgi:dipeptidyl aminopeptidase/acylaminoacyl peptidase